MNLKLHQLAREWVKMNHETLRKYRGEWIAYNGEEGVIQHNQNADVLIEQADATGKSYILKYVNPYTYSGLRRLLPVRFRPLRNKAWEPTYSVNISFKNKSRDIEMLVDSGADISTLSYAIGKQIGFNRFEEEVAEVAAGVNGTVEYVIRKIKMEIDGYSFDAPIAWLLDEKCEDILLGREKVFDVFDVEFRQKDEII
jgi:Aspartyl protease/Family of unknown function (DUF5678)